MKRLLLLAASIILTSFAFTQTGPGGIGNINGDNNQPQILFWIDAGTLDLNNNEAIKSWTDISENTLRFNQTIESYKPKFNKQGVNRFPSVSFDGVDDYLVFKNANKLSVENKDISFFAVYRNDDGNTEVKYFDLSDVDETNTPTLQFVAGDLYVGKLSIKDENAWKGELSELICYGKSMNSVQKTIIENYLNHKYNLQITDKHFANNDPNFIFDISGIGKEADGAQKVGYSAGLTIESNGGLDENDYLFFAHNNAVNDIANANKKTFVTSSGAEAAWNREWFIKKTGSQNITLKFDFNKGFKGGQNPVGFGNYVLLYRANTSENYTKIMSASGITDGLKVFFNVANQNLNDGYYTIGTINQDKSPVEGKAGRTWYPLISGNWENWEVWTLDPSGALPNNPAMEIPSDDALDNVEILSGKTITVNSNNITNANIVVDGELDLQSTSGHTFTTIEGSGIIRMSADNFPAGDASHFYTGSLGGGTAVYYGSSYTLSTARTFYNLNVELDNKTDVLTQMADYQINGDFSLQKGEWQINDNSSTTRLNLTVDNTLTVSDTASISVGTADAYSSAAQSGYGNYHKGNHLITIGGDFYNYGIVKLTNQAAPDYDSRATNGAASLVFTGAQNNKFYCDSTTDVYYLVVDKGTDRTYELELFSTDSKFFALFGDNDENWDFTVTEHPENRKALWIKAGTLRFTGNLKINTLTEGSRDWTIGQYAAMVLDGVDVFVALTANENTDWTELSHGAPSGVDNGGSNQGLYPFGKLQVDNGHFYQGESEAINFRDEAPGIIEVNGGLLEVNQIAISSSATNGYFSFILNGGEVRLTGEYGVDNGRAVLNLDKADMAFTMTGGTLNIQDVSTHSPNGIHILSAEGNYNVTGGTVNIDAGANVQIYSTAPFYDFNVKNGSTATLQYALWVKGDLTIENGATLDTDGNDVKVGTDFNLNDGGTYTHDNNTTYFTGGQSGYINVLNTANAGELEFYNLSLTKNQQSDPSLFYRVQVNSPGRSSNVHPVNIVNKLYVQRGEFDVDEWEVDVQGNVEIVDGQIISSETTNPQGWLVLNGAVQQTIKGSSTKEQEFGSIELDNTNGLLLLSNINATDVILTPNGGNALVDLDIYNLDISGDITLSSGSFGNNIMFETSGNASDGGLSLSFDLENRAYATETVADFPIGTGGVYNPTEIYIDGNPGATTGTVSMNGVDGVHPSVSDPTKALDYYWNVEVDGFSGIDNTSVNYIFTYSAGFGSTWQCMKLYEGTTDWETANDDSSPDIPFYDVGMLGGSFSLGNPSQFVNLTIFYSRQDGDWSDKNSWSKDSYGGSASNKTPDTYDIVKIGYSGSPGAYVRHRITLDVGTAAAPTEIAELVLEQNPEAGADENEMSRLIILPTVGLQVNGTISGDGEIQFQMDGADIPTLDGDLGDFVNTEGASFIMRSNDGNVTAPSNLTRFPRLSIPGASSSYIGTRSVTFSTDIYCHNLNVRYGGTLLLNNGANGDIEIRDSLRIGGIGSDNEGRIIYQNSGTARTIIVGGNLILDTDGATYDNNQLYVETGGTDNLEHSLQVYGDILLRNPNSLLDLYTANDGNQSNIILELLGEDNGVFTDANNTDPELYRIELNKSGAGTPTFSFDDVFSLNGPTNSTEKALELTSGKLILNDASIDVTLSSGGANFEIPAAAELSATSSATVRVSGNNTGIYLDGKITAGSGSKWYINGGTNNYIQYSSSGSATIDIEDAEFYVGSQIRRSAITDDGILSFNQNNASSTVIIGTNADDGGETNRGVFELVNNGSEFIQADDAVLTIANAVTNATAASLYLDIDALDVSLGDGSKIQFGSATTDLNQDMTIYSSVPLKNIEIDNSSTNNPEVSLKTVSLIADTLTIASGATFDGNALDLTLYGDLVNNGTFTANNNTTYFSGTVNQQVTGAGTSNFYNLTYNGGLDFAINDDVTVDNIFNHTGGTFTDNDNTLTVNGNINFAGTHSWGGTSNGIYLAGINEQIMTGAGTYGRLTIENANGVTIDPNTGSGITITNELQLDEGIFDIDQYLLTLQTGASITTTATFDANTLIQTNISFTDAGIKKFFPAIAATTDYTFPVGVQGKYTPVEMSIDAVDAGGNIRIKAANEMQPTISDDNDECNEFDDTQNVLQYHWVLESTSITNFTGSMTMTYSAADALVNNTWGYDLTDYIAARILTYGDNSWNKYDETNVDEGNNQLLFDFSGTDDAGISGDYTAGIEQEAGCNGAIPNTITEYITLNATNSWTDPNDWAVYDSDTDTHGAAGVGVPASGPRGAIVYIDDNQMLEVPGNYISAYKTFINEGATLDLGTTFGHRLGIVSGTGTLYVERGELPAGIFEEFFSGSGGTLEFGGNTQYTILGGLTEVNNIICSGSSVRLFPNNNVLLNGDLIINGPRAIHYRSKTITLLGDLIKTSGEIRFAYYDNWYSVVEFASNDDQLIQGSISNGSNESLGDVILNKPSGKLILNNEVTIKGGVLSLNNGIIEYTGSGALKLTSSSTISGGSSSSFINGPLHKELNSSTDFIFPIGKDTIYRPIGVINPTNDALWVAEYTPSNASTDLGAGLVTVSSKDSWDLTASDYVGTEFAKIKLYWGTETNVSPNAADHADLKVVYKDDLGIWQDLGNASYSGDVNSGWLISQNQVEFSANEFTIASSTPANPLPVTLIDFTAKVENENQVALSWKTSFELNNDYFIIERSRDGVVFEEVSRVNGNGTTSEVTNYRTTDYDPYTGISYYRLKQVDYDGAEEVFPMVVVEIENILTEELRLNIHPNPYRSGDIVVDISGFNNNEKALVMISDISGNPIWQGKTYPDRSELSEIIGEKLKVASPGFYLVIVVSKDKKMSARIIKE